MNHETSLHSDPKDVRPDAKRAISDQKGHGVGVIDLIYNTVCKVRGTFIENTHIANLNMKKKQPNAVPPHDEAFAAAHTLLQGAPQKSDWNKH